MVYDAQYNIYAALIHQDPTKYPDHIMNSLHMDEYLTLNLDKFFQGTINFEGEPFDFVYNISLTYYEHMQKMAIFRLQREKKDLERIKRELETYNQIFIQLLFPKKINELNSSKLDKH